MATAPPAPQRNRKDRGRIYFWLQRNERRLLATNIACIVMLLFLHILTSTSQDFAQETVVVVQVAAIVTVSFIALSLVWKGVIPLIICILGIVLMHNSVILPYYAVHEVREVFFWGHTFFVEFYTPASVSVGATMNFLLGLSMVALSIIIAYQPSLLFARNRPEPFEAEWSKYPVWHDNALLADGRMDRKVSIQSLMTDQDRYLMWRYEYVLANIYGKQYLVNPNGLVPEESSVFRDKESGRVVGKARYSGFFV